MFPPLNMTFITRRTLLALPLALGAEASLGVLPASAQSFPNRPLRLVVPFPPGGSTDILARLVALKLGEALSQPVIVENRSGAGGMIGVDSVANSPSDGYTLLVGSSGPIVIAPDLQDKVGYDSLRDFAPILMIATILPTVAESGVVSLFGIMAPAGTPGAVVLRLNDELVKIMRMPDVAGKLSSLDAEPLPKAFSQAIAGEMPKWAEIIRKSWRGSQ